MPQTVTLNFESARSLNSLYAGEESNLREIEKVFKVKLTSRDAWIKVQGKTRDAAQKLLDDAISLEQAGAFAVVLELVPAEVSRLITRTLTIPTIGIGAGPYCDGQVQVIHDVLGLFTDFVPKHAKQYAKLADIIRSALSNYLSETKAGTFPTMQYTSSIDESLLEGLGK